MTRRPVRPSAVDVGVEVAERSRVSQEPSRQEDEPDEAKAVASLAYW